MIIAVCIIALISIGGVAILSRREHGDMFTRMSQFLYKQLCIHGLLKNAQVETDLERLYPGVSVRTLQMDYYVEKFRLVLLVFIVGSVLTLFLGIKAQLEGNGLQQLERAEAGAGGEEVELIAEVGSQKEQVSVYVEERMLTDNELDVYLKECIKELEQIVLGENISANEITKDLYLVDSLEGYPFEITWKSSDSMIIDSEGKLKEVSGREGEVVSLTASINYGEKNFYQEFVMVLGHVEKKSSLQEKLYLSMKEQDEASKYEEVLLLPQEVEGEEIYWKQKQDEAVILFLGLTFFAAIGVFFLKDKDLHEQVVLRKRSMKMVYPAILNKFVLYMSAGMTVRGSFVKIATDYQKSTKAEEKNPAYEEMLYSCNELSAGVSEGLVYERFGKRTGLQEYARFAGMLGQNLKKGNAALLGRLREEADKAMLENLQFRKKLGEEAETKLLVPMIMMMGIVMLLVMIPAFTSFE